jgi:hypothetical protein
VTKASWVSCRDGRYDEKDTMLGFEVVRVKTDFPMRLGSDGLPIHMTHDDWQAAELGCYPLKRTTTLNRHGVAGSRTVTEVKQVVIGEPDPKLFEVPANGGSH